MRRSSSSGARWCRTTSCAYRLLAEPEITRRSDIIRIELVHLDRMVAQAMRQQRNDLDRGIQLN